MSNYETLRELAEVPIISEDNIKMDLQKVGWRGMDWIALAQDRDRWWALVSAVMNTRVS
jgi:hypothetical protein